MNEYLTGFFEFLFNAEGIYLIIPSIAAASGLQVLYGKKLQTFAVKKSILAFVIYGALWLCAAVVSPMLIALFAGSGAGFLWMYYVLYAPILVPVFFLLQLIGNYFVKDQQSAK